MEVHEHALAEAAMIPAMRGIYLCVQVGEASQREYCYKGSHGYWAGQGHSAGHPHEQVRKNVHGQAGQPTTGVG